MSNRNPNYTPTIEQIERMKKKIRSEWSEKQEMSRFETARSVTKNSKHKHSTYTRTYREIKIHILHTKHNYFDTEYF